MLAFSPLIRALRGELAPAPAWAPAAGQIKQISHAAGYFGTNGGATLAEISPQYQAWNPTAPSITLYGNGYGWGSYYSFCGSVFNTDTRQIVLFGAGHAAINVCAPSCFDLTDLRWKWLDTPLPFDAFAQIANDGITPWPATQAATEVYYPPEQYNYAWGDLNGDWSGWPSGYGRPGKIQPVPIHSRAILAHVPASVCGNAKGALLNASGHGGLIANYSTGSHLFDYDTASWSRDANWLASYGGGRVFDAVTQKAIGFGNATLASTTYLVYDFTTRTWSTRTATNSAIAGVDHGGNLIHEASRLHICPQAALSDGTPPGNGAGVYYKFHATPIDAIVGTGSFSSSLLTVSATTWPLTSLGNNRYMGWSYCPVDKCLYITNGEHNSNKYWRLAPPVGATTQAEYLYGTWTLTEHTFTSGTIQSPGTYTLRSMMFSRMQWDALSKSFVFWPDSNTGPVQAWRPAGIS